MYIAPQTVVKLLSGVKLSPDKSQTAYFSSKTAQTAYFTSKTISDRTLGTLGAFSFTLDSLQFRREGESEIVVNIPSALLYDCNYLMFQNAAFSSKWFYAFVESVEYVSNAVSRIRYRIDNFQTWFTAENLQECLIEREHTASDELFEHLLPDVQPPQQFEYHAIYQKSATYNTLRIISTTTTELSALPPSGLFQGTFSMLPMKDFTAEEFGGFPQAEILEYLSSIPSSSVVSGYQYDPDFFKNQTIALPSADSTPGYVPKNKKMYSAPYRAVCVFTSTGQSIAAGFESGIENVVVKGAVFPSPEIRISFDAENGLPGQKFNAVQLSGNVTAAVTGNLYNDWKLTSENTAQSALAVSAITSLGSVGLSAASGNVAGVLGGLTSIGAQIANLEIKKAELKALPPSLKTSASGSGISAPATTLAGSDSFGVYLQTLKPEVAEMVDHYFTMYGYNVSRVGLPSISNRPAFTFCKTQGQPISPNGIPAEACRDLNAIFNSGVTVWVNADSVGDYSIENSPV